MEQFVCQFVLPPPTTGPRKRRKRTRKLATFTHKSSKQREHKTREQELNNIAKNAMEILQAHGITAQTSPYPLAIADIHGNMRSRQKSLLLNTLTSCTQFNQALSNVCPTQLWISLWSLISYTLYICPHHRLFSHSMTTFLTCGNKPSTNMLSDTDLVTYTL